MPRALVIQHTAAEGIGRFAKWMPARGLELKVVHPYAGEALPDEITDDALIVMGGPMGAYDDLDVPWLSATKMLLAESVSRGLPTLGVCLGAQLLAVATGGKVERGAAGPELGLGEVVADGRDPVLIDGSFPVVQWHYDTVTQLPPEAALLATSGMYRTQAFRVGAAAWGLQFHIEATPELVGEWALAEGRDVESLVSPVTAADPLIAQHGERIAGRFADFVTD